MSNYANLPAPSSGTGLAQYLSEIRKFPILEPDEEYILAKRWVEDKDSVSAHKLVTSHLRLAAKIALGYRGYGLPISDVISEANVGLMQAVKRFDPEKGFRLATYAMWWIRASVQEYILKSWSLVKLGTTSSQKKLFFNLRKAKARIGALDDADLKPEDTQRIAEMLNVSEDDVLTMNGRLSGQDSSLNKQLRNDGEGFTEHQDLLVDKTADHARDFADKEEASLKHKLLMESLSVLNDREKDIFMKRNLDETPSTLETLSIKYGVSRERIRQIEARALEKVKKRLLNLAAEKGLMPNPA